MSGKLIEALRRTDYSFSAMTTNQTLNPIFIAEDLPIAEYRENTVQVRFHKITWPVGAQIDILVYGELPCEEDPGSTFRTANALASGTLTQASNPQLPLLLAGIAVPANAGGFVSVALQPKTGANAGTFTFTLSMALSLKS